MLVADQPLESKTKKKKNICLIIQQLLLTILMMNENQFTETSLRQPDNKHTDGPIKIFELLLLTKTQSMLRD